MPICPAKKLLLLNYWFSLLSNTILPEEQEGHLGEKTLDGIFLEPSGELQKKRGGAENGCCLMNNDTHSQLNGSSVALNDSRPFSGTYSQHYTGAYGKGQMKTWREPKLQLSHEPMPRFPLYSKRRWSCRVLPDTQKLGRIKKQ